MPGRPVTTRSLVLVILAAVAVVALGAVQKGPCAAHERADTSYASKLCYSDVPVLYAERGLNLPIGWFGGENPRIHPIEYPPLTVLFMEASARVTQHLDGDTPAVLAARQARAGEPIPARGPFAPKESTFYWVSAAALAPFGVAALVLLVLLLEPAAAQRFALVAVPLVVATGFINWDLLPMFLVTAALLAWRAGRPGVTGVALGLGTAAKLYPALLLGPIIVLGLRERRLRPALVATVSAAAAWLVVNAPAYLLHPHAWREFWHFNSTRPADFGSAWYAAHLVGLDVPASTINIVYLGWLVLACLGVLAIGLRAPRTPDLAALGLLLVTAFVVANKVDSPQYVLWTLPLVALSCRSGRLLAFWCVSELLYFVVVWQYLTNSAPWVTPTYVVLLLLRLAAEVAVAVWVARDLMSPDLAKPVADEHTPTPAAHAEPNLRS